MSKKVLLITLLFLSCCLGAQAQQVALKTNLLYWATTTPNLDAEFAVSRHSTVNVSIGYNPWTIGVDNKIQHWLVQPEYRYWFSEKFTRAFVGVHLFGGGFEVGKFPLPFNALPSLKTHYYKGWAVGVGVGVGYSFYISPHWSLEAKAGAGIARVNYYSADSPSYKRTRYLPVPTELGISFVYLFRSKK